MNVAVYIAIFAPIYIMLFVTIPSQNRYKITLLKKLKKQRGNSMTNELILKYIGKICVISTGSFGTTVRGKLLSAVDNIMEIETSKGNVLVNVDFVTSIKPISS